MLKFMYLIFLFITVDSCATPLTIRVSENSSKDSTSYIAEYFLSFDVFINSYYCTERDLYELSVDHPEWISDYFPTILDEYDLTLFTQFQIAIQLYKINEKSYLNDLWNNFSRLKNNPEFSPIIKELSNQNIILE
jgi:hypothetical protein